MSAVGYKDTPTINEKNFPGSDCIGAIGLCLCGKKSDIKKVELAGNNDLRKVWLIITLKNGKTYNVTADLGAVPVGGDSGSFASGILLHLPQSK